MLLKCLLVDKSRLSGTREDGSESVLAVTDGEGGGESQSWWPTLESWRRVVSRAHGLVSLAYLVSSRLPSV